MANDLRIAVDISGTFTDVVLDSGRACGSPARCSPRCIGPRRRVLDEVHLMLADAGEGVFSDVGVFVHGTTLATNTARHRAARCVRPP